MKKTLGSNMKWAIAHSGIAAVRIAERLGISEGALRHYLNDRNEPKINTLKEFCAVVRVPIEVITDYRNNPYDVEEKAIEQQHSLSQIDVIDAYLSAGSGVENNSENIIGQIAFSTHFLDREGIKASEAKIVQVNGSSMEPTLANGSLVMVDMRDNEPTTKALVFALRIGDETFVKRLEKVINGPLLVHSDNPQWQTEVINGDSDVQVIGKVVWSARTWPDNRL